MNRNQTPFKQTQRQHPIPFNLDGSFHWLEDAKTHKAHIGVSSKRKLPSQLKHAVASAAKHQLLLPDIFLTFCRSATQPSYFRSATDCYLDVGKQVLTLADGFLLRFLVDSQGCAFWYLYMRPGTQDHAVVMSTDYFDADDEDSSEVNQISQKQFLFDSPSFEYFLCRFWLENEIFFAEDEGTEPPNVGKKFLKLYSSYNDVFE
jgi:hypothetical protein